MARGSWRKGEPAVDPEQDGMAEFERRLDAMPGEHQKRAGDKAGDDAGENLNSSAAEAHAERGMSKPITSPRSRPASPR